MPERIYRGTLLVLWRHTNCLAANKSQEQHSSSQQAVGPAWWPLFFFLSFLFFLSRDLALIHSHSSDVLTPKGPCPGGDWTAHAPARSAKKKKKRPDGGQLLSFYRIIVTTFSAQSEMVLKKSWHLTFWVLLLFSHISFFLCCQLHKHRIFFSFLSLSLFFFSSQLKLWLGSIKAYCMALDLTYRVALRHTGAQVWVGARG